MKAVFFCRFFYPHIGGVEKHVYELSKRLMKKGWDITVITELHEKNLKKKEVYEDIIIYRIPLLKDTKGKKYMIWNWLFLHRSILKEASVIHCHDVFFWYLPFRFLFPFKKIYTTFHGYEGDSLPSNRSLFMHKMAEVLSMGTICVGEYLKKWFGTKTNLVTYGAVVLPRNDGRPQKKKINELVFIGRLDPEACILPFLEVLNILKQQGFLPHMSVLGEGSLAEQAKIFVRRHRLNVTFFGAVADIHAFLSRADAVFTSRYLSTLESFSYRKYVFCLYNNAIHKDYFFLSPFHKWVKVSGDALEMADSVRTLIEHPNSHDEDSERAYAWVKNQSWDRLTKLYLELWRL